tara:strand:- start:280 stop:654 length:375 start_codon:yes stop_codon:yes gene_type:complete
MSILTKIDSIPVFTKKSEALAWARLNGFIGCDKYTYLGQMGYMPAKARAGSAYSKIYTKTITVDVNYIDTEELVTNPSENGVIMNQDTTFDRYQDPGSQDVQDDTGGDDTGGGEGGESETGGGY